MLRILIADDHPVFRRGLREIITENADMTVEDEAVNGWEALEKGRDGDYDVLLLDITMPGPTGVAVLTQLKKEAPRLPVLILTAHPEDQYAIQALKAGASGYLTKENAPDELITAIRKVTGGGKYISPSLADKLASYIQNDSEKAPHEAFSDREYQVMQLICSGKTVSEIARELSLSIKTISTYRARIFKKTALKNDVELVRYAIKNQLLD